MATLATFGSRTGEGTWEAAGKIIGFTEIPGPGFSDLLD